MTRFWFWRTDWREIKNSRFRSSEFKVFQAALNHVCLELAKKIVRDGEGVHRVVTVRVNGAKTIQDADAAARAVANSALVKTSWHGGDPNWGRIIDALGYSSAKIVEEKVDIGYSATAAEKNSLEFETRAADEGDVQGTLCRRCAEGI